MTTLQRLTLLHHGLAIAVAGALFPIVGWILRPADQQMYALWLLACLVLAVVCYALKNYVAKSATAAERKEAREEGLIR